ncbi:MAG TPA: diacylglycerol kinase family protein [Anaerolineae bacterium]|nr:diacylglycerol kinase family protein [Anaerolineae bacterium]
MQRLIRSFGYAFAGLGHGLHTQVNLRIHVAITIGVVAAGLLLQISTVEWAILVVTIMIVMAAELFNTALEALIDRVGPEYHPLSKVAKDTAAGAVLIGAIGAVIVGLLIFGPRLLALIGQG